MRTRSVLSWFEQSRLTFPFVLVLAALLRLYRLDALSFWLDESATAGFALGLPWEIWGTDTHPPLYYSLMALWRLLGEDEWTLRLSSLLFSLGAVAALYAAGATLGGRLAGVLAALLLALSPMSIAFAQEFRMYALLELCVALALLGFVRIAAGARGWWLYGLGTLLALYTHNMAFLWLLAANAAFLALLWRAGERRTLLRRWALANLLVLLCWAAYWPALLAQADRVVGDFWIVQPAPLQALGDVGHIAFGLGGTFDPVEQALALLMLAVACAGLVSLRAPGLALALVILVLLPPLLAYGLALVARPLFYARTLLWIGLPVQLALGLGLAWLLRSARTRPAAVALSAAAVAVAVIAVRGALAANSYDRVVKADWRGLTARIAALGAPGDRLVVTPEFEIRSLDYYVGRTPAMPVFAQPVERVPTAGWPGVADFAARLRSGERVWLVRSLNYPAVLDVESLLRAAQPCLETLERLDVQYLEAVLLERPAACPP